MQQLLNSLSFIIQSSLESSPVLYSIFVVLISFFWWTWPYKLDSKLPGPPSCTTDPFNSNLLPPSSLPFTLKNHLAPTSSYRNFTKQIHMWGRCSRYCIITGACPTGSLKGRENMEVDLGGDRCLASAYCEEQ